MSGFYNNWIKVQNPNMLNDIVPMESGGYQKPFFFGGSQVPTALEIPDRDISGSGYSKINFKPIVKGKGVQKTNHHKHSNIHLPRHMSL
jgi:hypothetical protein